MGGTLAESPRESHALMERLTPARDGAETDLMVQIIRCLVLIAFSMAFTGLLAPEVQASNVKAEALNAEGMARYKAEDFIGAAEAFMEAFAQDPAASLLWNAARAYDRGAAIERAREAYKRYATHPDATPEKRKKAREWLAIHPKGPDHGSVKPTSSTHTTTKSSAPLSHDRVPDGAMSPQSMVGWTLNALGFSAVIAGSVVMILAADARDATNALVWDQNYKTTFSIYETKAQQAQSLELGAWLSYGAALALVGGGLALLLSKDASQQSSSNTLGLVPTQGGVMASGSWQF